MYINCSVKSFNRNISQNFTGRKCSDFASSNNGYETHNYDRLPPDCLRGQYLLKSEQNPDIPEFPEAKSPMQVDINDVFADLKQSGTRFLKDYIGIVRDNGQFVYSDRAGNYFVINVPADNFAGYSFNAKYDDEGMLVSEKRVEKNSDGSETLTEINFDKTNEPISCYKNTYINGYKLEYSHIVNTRLSREFVNHKYSYINGDFAKKESKTVRISLFGKPQKEEFSEIEYNNNLQKTTVTTVNNVNRKKHTDVYQYTENKILSAYISDDECRLNGEQSSEEEIYDAIGIKGLKNREYDSIEDLNKKRIPNGCYFDKEKNELVKVDKDKIKVEVAGNRDNGGIVVYDEFGKIIGHRDYERQGSDLWFNNYSTGVNGLGIGTLIMDESLKLAEKYGTGITGCAGTNVSSLLGCPKKPTNLGYYYKLGYRVQDKGADRLIQDCLDKGYEIPVVLNKNLPTRYVGKNSKVGSGSKHIKISDIKRKSEG